MRIRRNLKQTALVVLGVYSVLFLLALLISVMFSALARAEPVGLLEAPGHPRLVAHDDDCAMPGVIGMKYRVTWQDPPTPPAEGQEAKPGRFYEGCFRIQRILGDDARPVLGVNGQPLNFFIMRFDDGSTVVLPASAFVKYRGQGEI